MMKSKTRQHYEGELAKSDDFEVCPVGTMRRVEELKAMLHPFAHLTLGPSGYCSFPLRGLCEEARALLAKLNAMES